MMKLFGGGSSKEREQFMVIIKVVTLDIPVKEEVKQVHIDWVRGDFKREGQKKFNMGEGLQKVENINEMFLKQSKFIKLKKINQYKPKNCLFNIQGLNNAGKTKVLGELEIELTQFIGKGYVA